MKKIKNFLLTFIAVLVLMNMSFVCSATSDVKVIDVAYEKHNNKSVVTINIPVNSNVSAMEFNINYNFEKLKYVGFVSSEVYDAGFNQINDKTAGKIVCAYVSLVPVNEACRLISFEFSSDKSSEVYPEDFKLIIKDMADSSGRPISNSVKYTGFNAKQNSESTNNSGDTDEDKNVSVNTPDINESTTSQKPNHVPEETKNETILSESIEKEDKNKTQVNSTKESNHLDANKQPIKENEEDSIPVDDANETGKSSDCKRGNYLNYILLVGAFVLLMATGVIVLKRGKGK